LENFKIMVNGVAETLTKIGKKKTTKDKIEALKKADSLGIRIMLQAAYDSNVEFLLPEGAPPYKKNELVDQEHIFLKEANYVTYFIKGFHPNLTQTKREYMFVQFLERLAPEDAEMLVQAKDKIKVKGITLNHINEAFPGLIPENVEA